MKILKFNEYVNAKDTFEKNNGDIKKFNKLLNENKNITNFIFEADGGSYLDKLRESLKKTKNYIAAKSKLPNLWREYYNIKFSNEVSLREFDEEFEEALEKKKDEINEFYDKKREQVGSERNEKTKKMRAQIEQERENKLEMVTSPEKVKELKAAKQKAIETELNEELNEIKTKIDELKNAEMSETAKKTISSLNDNLNNSEEVNFQERRLEEDFTNSERELKTAAEKELKSAERLKNSLLEMKKDNEKQDAEQKQMVDGLDPEKDSEGNDGVKKFLEKIKPIASNCLNLKSDAYEAQSAWETANNNLRDIIRKDITDEYNEDEKQADKIDASNKMDEAKEKMISAFDKFSKAAGKMISTCSSAVHDAGDNTELKNKAKQWGDISDTYQEMADEFKATINKTNESSKKK